MKTSSQITPAVYRRTPHGSALVLAQGILRARDQDRVQVRVSARPAPPDEIAAAARRSVGAELVGSPRRRAEELLLAHLQRAPVGADHLLAVRRRHLELIGGLRRVD